MNASTKPGVVNKKRFSILFKFQLIAALAGAVITILVLYIYLKTSPHQWMDNSTLSLFIVVYPAAVVCDFFNVPFSLAKDNGHGGSGDEYTILGVILPTVVNALLLFLVTTLVGLLIKFIKKANEPM